MRLLSAIGGGFAGACALTLAHEILRRVNRNAPRMDRIGMEAIGNSLNAIHVELPDEESLFQITMVGDILSNSLYYSCAAIGDDKNILLRGSLLGLAAGVGGVYLPRPLGLHNAPSRRTTETKLLTVGIYLLGGVVAAIAGRLIEKNGK